MFFNFFKNTKLDDEFFHDNLFDHSVQVPFTVENNRIELSFPRELVLSLKRILLKTRRGKKPENKDLIKEFMEELKFSNFNFQNLSKDDIH